MADTMDTQTRPVRRARLAVRVAYKMPHGTVKVGPTMQQSLSVNMSKTATKGSAAPSMASLDDLDGHDNVPEYQDTEMQQWIREVIKKRVCIKFVPKEKESSSKSRAQPPTVPPPLINLPPPEESSSNQLLLPPLQQNPENQLPGSIPSPKKVRDPVCQCGYKRSRHLHRAKGAYVEGDKEWKVGLHTAPFPTDTFGDMDWGYGQRTSKYIRVDHMTDMESMVTLLTRHWKLKKPNLLISVTGGAKNFTMRPRLKEVFRRGLMKAAETTGAWIITGGMHAGVMKHVGEAVRDYTVVHGNKKQVVTLGISPWGAVNNKECLISKDGMGLWPAAYRVKESNVRGQSPIDPNHSHFILVDNGTQHKFATEIAFRTKLESHVSRLTSASATNYIPIVCVVLEGGPGTLETVKSAIQNGTPAVIVQGSGRAADVLAYAYANSTEEEVEVTDKFGKKHKKVIPIFDNDLFTKVRQMIIDEWKTDKDIDSRVSWVKDCLEKRDHMTVFQLDGSNSAKDIDLAILQALLKVNKDNMVDQLRLALAWNRIDVAKSEIFTDDATWETGDLDEVMYSAIMNDCVDFVALFMENGVQLKEYLTVKRLLHLYNGIPENSLLYQLLKKKKDNKRNYVSLFDVGHLILDLTGDFYHPLYLRGRYKRMGVDHAEYVMAEVPSRVSSTLSLDEDIDQAEMVEDVGGTLSPISRGDIYIDSNDEVITLPPFDEPSRELFLWSVLMLRLDMAMHFWEEGKEGIAAALTAQRILKSLRSKTDDSEMIKEIDMQFEYYQNLAVGVLSECYMADEKRARMMLVRELPLFGRATAVQLAVEADNKKFIAHAACQSLLNNIWMGRMTNDNGLIKLWLCMLFPCFIFPLVKFRPKRRLFGQEPKAIKDKKIPPVSNVDPSKQARPKTSQQRRTEEEEKKEEDSSGMTWYQKIAAFYNAPVITFFFNCVSYIAFLLIYSYVLLVLFTFDKMYPSNEIHFDPWEIVLILWIGSLLIEEIRQIIAYESSNIRLKIRSYVTDTWNILDIIAILTFSVGLTLRCISPNTCSKCFTIARIIYALNLMTFFFRILHMFSVHKELGPKLVMIGKMMIDLCFFVIILMVFVAAYGIATQAIMFPGSALTIGLVRDILQRPYFQIFGELFLETIEGDSCPDEPCPEETARWFVPILLGVYILITNVLMLNLLIAMFSYTFSMIQDRTDQHWYFQRYFLIKEYYDRPPLMPPLIVISHLFLIVRFFLQKCCKTCLDVPNVFSMKLSEQETKQIILWENMYADEFLRQDQINKQSSEAYRIKDIDERVDSIATKVDEMAEVSLMMQTGSQQQNSQYKLPAVLDDRLTYLEEQLQRTAKALNWIIDSMADKGGKAKPNLPDIDGLREEARKQKEEVMKKKKEEFEAMLKRQLELHIKSRTTRYPAHSHTLIIQRVLVPDEKVPWDVEWPDYEPIEFTDQRILNKPSYADNINLLAFPPESRPKLLFNQYDTETNTNRVSLCGEYIVKEGIPYNPKGRTGLSGRGVLGHWGPNQAGDPVVTRWKRNERGEVLMENSRPVLEFVSIQRSDNKEWAIPGGILEGCQEIHECLKAEFAEEALGAVKDTPQGDKLQESLSRLWPTGVEVYRGYADDHRNTDNAWLETIAINYHDGDGSIFRNISIRAGNNVELVRWQRISSRQPLYGGHLTTLQKVAERHKAAF